MEKYVFTLISGQSNPSPSTPLSVLGVNQGEIGILFSDLKGIFHTFSSLFHVVPSNSLYGTYKQNLSLAILVSGFNQSFTIVFQVLWIKHKLIFAECVTVQDTTCPQSNLQLNFFPGQHILAFLKNQTDKVAYPAGLFQVWESHTYTGSTIKIL